MRFDLKVLNKLQMDLIQKRQMLRAEVVDLRETSSPSLASNLHYYYYQVPGSNVLSRFSLDGDVVQRSQPDVGCEEHHKGPHRWPHLATSD